MAIRTIKNLLGRLRGFGGCPNCDDRYSWKEPGTLPFEIENDQVIKNRDGTIKKILSGYRREVVICTTCLSEPANLNTDRIADRLASQKWPRADIAMVRTAIDKLKAPQAIK